jgi:hypothetical protein
VLQATAGAGTQLVDTPQQHRQGGQLSHR